MYLNVASSSLLGLLQQQGLLPSVCCCLHDAFRHPAPHLRDLRPNTHGRSEWHVDVARYKFLDQGQCMLHKNWRVLEHAVDAAAGEDEHRRRNYIDVDYKQIKFHSNVMSSVVLAEVLNVV